MSIIRPSLRKHLIQFTSSSGIHRMLIPRTCIKRSTRTIISVPSSRQTLPQSGFKTIPSTKRIEEELLPSYKPEDYYPVYIGEVFQSRYQVVSKLGYGVSSTVWLCRDLWHDVIPTSSPERKGQYLTLKVCVRTKRKNNEIAISNHLRTRPQSHPGRKRVRVVLESFDVSGPNGTHSCLIYEPLGMNYTDLVSCIPDKDNDDTLPKDILQRSIMSLLMALDYIHEEGVIHTDVSSNNLLQSMYDTSIFTQIEESELKTPIPRKILPDRHIYLSHSMPISTGFPVLCDFDQARIGSESQHGDIMPGIYRAPEVILDMEWNEKVDIWAVGMTAWDLFEGSQMFFARRNGLLSNEDHLAEMVSLLGPPPADFIRRSERCLRYFDEEGNWKATTPLPHESFFTREHKLHTDDQAHFISFLRRILKWKPEERPSAGELISDDFLRGGVGV